jgi:serine protease Do
VVSRDPIYDIAILKIKGNNFPFLKLGDSDKIELGESVIAVGNALGEFHDTISAGIISGMSRAITAYYPFSNEKSQLRGLIQTDAAINPGNSGGPLINMKGEVIGINTAHITGAQNIGFAIPINYAKKDLKEVLKYGEIRRPFLGVRYIILNQEISKHHNLPVNYGALLVRQIFGGSAVVENSSAQKAGLKEYDIILEINGQKITEENPLGNQLQNYKIGQKIKLKILRENKEIIIDVILEKKK